MAKNVTPIVDEKTINNVVWTDPKQRDRFFRDLGHTANNAGVWASITFGAFRYVDACKRAEPAVNIDSDAVFTAFCAGRELAGGPGALSASSLPTYKSAIAGVVTAAATIPENYGAEALRDFIAKDCGKTSYSQRGDYIASILAAHPKVCGTREQMLECSPVNDRNVSQALQSAFTTLANVGKNDDWAADIGEHGLGEPYLAVLRGLKELAEASAKVIPLPTKGPAGKPKKGQSAAALALRI